MLDGYGTWLVCTGKSGARTKELLAKASFATEAEYFASIAEHKGVDKAHILLENQSTHSGENIRNTKSLLAEKKIDFSKVIVVTAPYAERRQRETYATRWSDQVVTITSPQLTFETYPNQDFGMDYLINALVGKVQRMKVYAEAGYQAPVVVPENVWQACERLIALGFTEQTISGVKAKMLPEGSANIKKRPSISTDA